MNLISLLNLHTYFLQHLIYCFAEYHSALFGRTYKMIQQYYFYAASGGELTPNRD
jgi:hypothetical protein